MIVRVFRAVVHDGKQEEFEEFFLGTALPLVKRQLGLVEVSVGRPLPDTPTDFLMTSIWRDLEALRTFAGDSWREALILPEEEHLLREVFVHHFELASEGSSAEDHLSC